MKHSLYSTIFFSFFLSISGLLSAESWRVFLYIDASDNLSDMAIKNITDALKVRTNEAVSFYVQLHAFDTTAYRYKITQNSLFFVEQVTLTGSSKNDFINAASWGFSNNTADSTMLIFSDHGFGILDPEWHEATQEWQAGQDHIANFSPIDHSASHRLHSARHKGCMFSVQPRVYLNNQDLVEGLDIIKSTVLNNKKIDIVAFDMCMGGMLENMHQIAPYTHYMVGNQVCALRDGFDYENIIEALNQQLSPRDLAITLVHIFDTYYKANDTTGVYAHVALDASYLDAVIKALNKIISTLLVRDDASFLALEAHALSPRFCVFPMYTDVVSYIKNLEVLLPDDESTSELKNDIELFYETMNTFVIAHCAGYYNRYRAQSCAIYLPTYIVHDSYTKTSFAQQTQWVSLLECIKNTTIIP